MSITKHELVGGDGIGNTTEDSRKLSEEADISVLCLEPKRDVLLGPARLYESLREQAVGEAP